MYDLGLDSIHTIIFIGSMISIVITLIWMYFHKHEWGYGIAPLTYFINVFLYNLVLHLTYITHTQFLTVHQLEIWSGIIRLHSLFLFLALVIFQPTRRHKYDGHIEGI